MIDGIFFDLDNTIIKYKNPNIDNDIIYDWLINCGCKNPDKIMFSNDWKNLEKRLSFFNIDYFTFMSNWNPQFKKSELKIKQNALINKEVSLYDHAFEFLRDIKTPKALITNSSNQVVQMFLSYFELNDLFDYVFTRNYDYLDLRKPNPLIANNAIKILNIKRNNIIMIGDGEVDKEFSKHSNLKFFNLHYKQHDYHKFFEDFKSLRRYCINEYPLSFKGEEINKL